jgi:hypothetical protein
MSQAQHQAISPATNLVYRCGPGSPGAVRCDVSARHREQHARHVGAVVRSWSGLECRAQQVAELIIGDAGRVFGPQPDGALARRQRGLADGVNRRRGGKRFALDPPASPAAPMPATQIPLAPSTAAGRGGFCRTLARRARSRPTSEAFTHRQVVCPCRPRSRSLHMRASAPGPGAEVVLRVCGHVCGISLTSTMRAGIPRLGRRTCSADPGGPPAVSRAGQRAALPSSRRRAAVSTVTSGIWLGSDTTVIRRVPA